MYCFFYNGIGAKQWDFSWELGVWKGIVSGTNVKKMVSYWYSVYYNVLIVVWGQVSDLYCINHGEKGKDIYKGKYRRGISCECRFNHANTPFTPFTPF